MTGLCARYSVDAERAENLADLYRRTVAVDAVMPCDRWHFRRLRGIVAAAMHPPGAVAGHDDVLACVRWGRLHVRLDESQGIGSCRISDETPIRRIPPMMRSGLTALVLGCVVVGGQRPRCGTVAAARGACDRLRSRRKLLDIRHRIPRDALALVVAARYAALHEWAGALEERDVMKEDWDAQSGWACMSRVRGFARGTSDVVVGQRSVPVPDEWMRQDTVLRVVSVRVARQRRGRALVQVGLLRVSQAGALCMEVQALG